MKKDFSYQDKANEQLHFNQYSFEELDKEEFELRHGQRESNLISYKNEKDYKNESLDEIKAKIDEEARTYEKALSSSAQNLEVAGSENQYEQEANQIANDVTNNVQSNFIPSNESLLQSNYKSDSGTSEVSDDLKSKIDETLGKGIYLSQSIKSEMENHLGNLDEVVLHTDSEAAELTEMMDAKAFTVGKDIYFNQGEYNPETDEGKWILAHELTHVVQAQKENDDSKIRRVINVDQDLGDDVYSQISYADTIEGLIQDGYEAIKEFKESFSDIDTSAYKTIIAATQYGLIIWDMKSKSIPKVFKPRTGAVFVYAGVWHMERSTSFECYVFKGSSRSDSGPDLIHTQLPKEALNQFSKELQDKVNARGYYTLEDVYELSNSELDAFMPAVLMGGIVKKPTTSGPPMEKWASDQINDLSKKLGIKGEGGTSKDGQGDQDVSKTTPLLRDTDADPKRPTKLVGWVRESDGKQFVNVWVGGRSVSTKDSKKLEKNELKEVEAVELKEGESIEDLQKRVEVATEKGRKRLTDKAVKEEQKLTGGNTAINDSTYLDGAFSVTQANHPAFRTTMSGPEIMTKNGTGAYTMSIHYEDEFPDLLGQVASAYHGSEYIWQIIDITSLYQQVMQEKAAAVQVTKDQLARGETPAAAAPGNSEKELNGMKQSDLSSMRTVRQKDADYRDLSRRYNNFTEDAAQAAHDLIHPFSSQDRSTGKAIRSVLVNTFNLATLPLDGILSLGGWLVSAVSGLMGTKKDYEREIPFPDQEGFYLVRCVAQPNVIGEGEKAIIRMPSVSVKVVQVQEIKKRTQDELNAQNQNLEASILELLINYRYTTDGEQLEIMRQMLEVQVQLAAQSNPSFLKKEIEKRENELAKSELNENIKKRVNEEIEILKQGTVTGSGLISEVIKKQIVIKKREIENETNPYKKRDLEDQLEQLNRRLSTSQARENEMHGDGQAVVRPQAVFVNEENGQTIPLLIEIGQVGSHFSDGYTIRVSDITQTDSDNHEAIGKTRADAIKNAINEYAGHFPYGRGYMMVRLPAELNFGVKEDILVRCNPRDTEQASNRLNELLQVLAVLGLFVPGVGVAVALVGGAVSAVRILKRLDNHTFAWDGDTAMDMLNIVGCVSMGASKVVGAKLVRANALFAIVPESEEFEQWVTRLARFKRVIDFVDASVNQVSYMIGSMDVVNEFLDIQQQEVSGSITHAEARRRRASLMAQAMHDQILQHGANVVGHFTGDGVELNSKVHESDVVPHDETIHPKDSHSDTSNPESKSTHPDKPEPTVGAAGSGTNNDHSNTTDHPKVDKTPEERVREFLSDRANVKALLKGDRPTLKKLLEIHGSWRDLMMHFQSESTSELNSYLIDELTAYRQEIVKDLNDKFGLKAAPNASTEAASDVDLASSGKDAGRTVIDAEKYMRQKYGDNWSELFRMNFYSAADRLFMYDQVQNLMSKSSYESFQAKVTELAELLNFAKMLQHAGDSASSVSRVEQLMSHLTEQQKTAIRTLAGEKPSQAKKKVAELHTTIDLLYARFEQLQNHEGSDIPESARGALPDTLPEDIRSSISKATTAEELKIALAQAISELQMMANFRTEEAYISPGAAKQVVKGTEVKGHEAYQSALSNLEMMEHILHLTNGNVEQAIREYELYKYISRFISATILAGIPLNSFMMAYYQAAHDIYKNNRTQVQGVNKHDLAYTKAMHDRFIEEAAEMLPKMKDIAEKSSGSSTNNPSSDTTTEKSGSGNEEKASGGSTKTNDSTIKEESSKVKTPDDINESTKHKVTEAEKQKEVEVLDELPFMSVMSPAEAGNFSDAHDMFNNNILANPKRETGLFYNEALDMYIIVQGDENQVAIDDGDGGNIPLSTEVQKWHELIDDPSKHKGVWRLVAHSHPQDASGKVSFVNRFPSGANGDMGAIIRQSIKEGYLPQSSNIYYLTDKGMEITFIRYYPYDPKPIHIDYPHPITGMRNMESFTSLQDYHNWMKKHFSVELGGIPNDLKKIGFADSSNSVPESKTTPEDTEPITVKPGKKNISNPEGKNDSTKNKKLGPVGQKDSFDMYRYQWPGDAKAYASFKVNGDEIYVDRINRGDQPKGSGGQMLAEAIKLSGEKKPKSLFASNIIQKAENSNEVVETTLKNAIAAMGGTVGTVTKGIENGNHWIRITINY